jgi:hypothetical protein
LSFASSARVVLLPQVVNPSTGDIAISDARRLARSDRPAAASPHRSVSVDRARAISPLLRRAASVAPQVRVM